jgi:hypothetical protein
LSANGDLDAVIDVFERQRSQNSPVDCRRTDRDGNAALAFTPSAGTTYLLRVSELSDSVSGTFSMRVFALPAPPTPPAGSSCLTSLASPGCCEETSSTTCGCSDSV